MSELDLSGKRILVVEDEAMVAMLLEDYLDELGCVIVGPYAEVEEAVRGVATEAIDAAVLDVNLAGTQSYAVADALADRGLPFVFITGYGAAGLKPGYESRPVLQKPFTSKTFRDSLSILR